MINVEYRPIEKIIVHDIREISYEEFVDLHATGDIRPRWVEGILFDFGGYPGLPNIIEQEMNGIIHWSWFQYARCEKYPKILERKDQKMEVPVINNKSNSSIVDFVKWLKTTETWNRGSDIGKTE